MSRQVRIARLFPHGCFPDKLFEHGRRLFKIIGNRDRDPAEVIAEDGPLWLTTDRLLRSYHTRTQTGRSACIGDLLKRTPSQSTPPTPRSGKVLRGF